MAKSKKVLHEGIRNKFMNAVVAYLEAQDEEVMRTKSNEIAIPTLDEDGNDEWCVITFKVPTGSRDDGEAYDGYGMAEEYTAKEAEKAVKAAEAEAKKQAKIAKDKAEREARAKAKAEHEAKKATEGE
jgi:flagellar biosynthesis/type III secretory pathway protein FliH